MQLAPLANSITAAIIGTLKISVGYYPYARPFGRVAGAPGAGRE